MRNRPKLSHIKRCGGCGKWRILDEFSFHLKARDGLQPLCKPCVRVKSREWRERNPEKWRAARDRWKAANPDKVRAIHRNTSHKRYAKKKDGVRSADLLAWEKAQPKVCHWCRSDCPDAWHVDHRVPLAKGGEHELRNLVIACPPCNLRKGAKDPIEFAQSNDPPQARSLS